MTLEQLAPWARTIAYTVIGVSALVGGVAATLVVEAAYAYGRRRSP